MRCLHLVTFVLLAFAAVALGQQSTQSQTGPALKNHHILLVPATAPGTGEVFWIAVAPDGQLAVLPVSQLQSKMGDGYRPFTFGEFQDALGMLMNQNAALNEEIKRLQSSQSAQGNGTVATNVSPSQSAAAMQAAAAAEAQRAQNQRRQAILMFLMGQQAQRTNMNVNVTDCTKFPALCINH